jgi:hypothetical protein
MNKSSEAESLKILAALLGAARPNITTSAWLASARDVVVEVEKANENKPAGNLAIKFARDVLDMIEARFPADYALCSARASALHDMIAEVGATIEFVFGKTAE